jgi:hypothetical protein
MGPPPTASTFLADRTRCACPFVYGGPSGLYVIWCDGFAKDLDLSLDPDGALDAVIQRRELVPYSTTIKWWDGGKKSGGGIESGFGRYKPLLVALKDSNNVTLEMQREALSYIARTTQGTVRS